LRVWWKLPKLSDRLTMLVIVGTRTAEHSLRSHVGIGSESHCLLGQLSKILEISDSEADLKVEKSGVFSEKKVNAEMNHWSETCSAFRSEDTEALKSILNLNVESEIFNLSLYMQDTTKTYV